MEIKRLGSRKGLSPRIIKRFKFMTILFLIYIAGVTSVNAVVDVAQWSEYDSIDEITLGRGQIMEYSTGDSFCRSWVIPPGFSLIHWSILAIFYFLVLCYMFLGISIIADIFMM